MMDEWERGWHGSDKLICPDCIGDDHLKAVVASAVIDDQACSFCGGVCRTKNGIEALTCGYVDRSMRPRMR
jgi:hypothetical protein